MIKDFFSTNSIAIAGASRNAKKFGNIVCRKLKEKGFNIYPVNPSGESICDLQTYKEIADLPTEVQHLIILTRKDRTTEIVKQAIAKGIQNIWIQQMSDSPEAIEIATEAGIHLICGKCLFMYAEPVEGMHKFHRGCKKLFGQLQE